MIDTAGNEILEIIDICDCGSTGGCPKCNPYMRNSFIGSITDKEAEEMKKRLMEFKNRFNKDFRNKMKIIDRVNLSQTKGGKQ